MFESVWSLALVLGVAVSIDLFFGTIGNYNNTSLSLVRWPFALAIFHIILYGVGSYLLFPLVEWGVITEQTVAWVGFVLVTLLVIDILLETAGQQLLPFGPKALAQKAGLNEENSNFTLMMLAFSLDALFAGLANPAIDSTMLLVGLGIGIVVGVCAFFAVLIAFTLRWFKPKDGIGHSIFNIIGNFCSTTAIATFGTMSLLRAIDIEGDWLTAVGITTVIIGFVYLVLCKLIWQTETAINVD